MEYLHETLPPSCELGVVSATGIVGTVETAYQGHWLECAQNMNQEILNFLEGTEDSLPSQPSKRARKDNTEEAEEKAKVASEVWKSSVGYSIDMKEDMMKMKQDKHLYFSRHRHSPRS